MHCGAGAVPAVPGAVCSRARAVCVTDENVVGVGYSYLFEFTRGRSTLILRRMWQPTQAQATGRCPRAERLAPSRAFPRFIPGCVVLLPGRQALRRPPGARLSHASYIPTPVCPDCVIQLTMCAFSSLTGTGAEEGERHGKRRASRVARWVTGVASGATGGATERRGERCSGRQRDQAV